MNGKIVFARETFGFERRLLGRQGKRTGGGRLFNAGRQEGDLASRTLGV